MRLTDDPDVAADALLAGHLAVLPTETVYGLGARADLPSSIARVYATKGRPADHPLIVHIPGLAASLAWALEPPDYARALAHAFWPGPLTLVARRTGRALDAVTGGQDTVALRVPAHPVALAVLASLARLSGDPDIGIAAPSANRFGRVSPTTAAHVVDELGGFLGAEDVVLDGGPCSVGVESTIVDCTGPAPVILRPGQVGVADVERVTGLPVGTRSAVRAPGMLESHYAPRAHVTVAGGPPDADPASTPTVGLLALSEVATPPGIVRLSAPATADEYARVLYAALREADALGLARVVAVPPGPSGIGAAVADRLARAASGG